MASLLKRDRQCLVSALDRLLENAAVSVAEGLALDLLAVKDRIRLGAERNWAVLEQSFRRHTTALAHIASESEHVVRKIHNSTFGTMATRPNTDPTRRSLR